MLISKSRCRPGPISRAQGVVLAGALVSSLLAAGGAHAAGRTMLVLDASGSMWGQIDGVNKITIAREVIGDLLDTLPEGEALGLVAYGHREKGNCADIETLVPAAVGNRDEIRRAVESLNPKGKTPMTDAVRIAAEALRYVEERATVVLVSDGIETCERDPCAVAAELEASGVDFTAHVVGFDVAGDAEAEAQLRCLAQNTGGNYYGAGDAEGLRAALGEVAVAVAAEPQYPEIVLTAPESAEVGSEFEVGRNTTVDPRDMILVVPMGAPDDQYDNSVRTQSGNPVLLRAHAEPGLYEVRYVVNATRDVIARAPIELVEAGVALEAPETATAGSRFEVSRDRTIRATDFIAIAPPDAKDDVLDNYVRVRDNPVVSLTAPAEPGLYELRYVLDEGRRVIGRRAIEVTEPQVALEAPDVVTAGAPFEVSRTATINSNDFVAIAAPDAKDSALENYKRARDNLVVTLTAPAEPGLYELRYVLDQGRSVIARRAIEVSAGEVSLEAPDVVTAGAPFEVSRTATINSNDFVAIAAPDAKDSALENYKRARDNLVVTLTAPAEPGLYELRYVLDQGRSVIARRAVEVAAASVELDAPATVTAGGEFEVARNTTVNVQDMLAMVPVGSPDNELGQSKRVRDYNPLAMKAPDEPGLYELRYVLDQGREVIARAMVEVVPVSAAIESPGQVVAGAPFAVAWEGPNRRGDAIELVGAGAAADATPLAGVDVGRGGEVRFDAPAEPGLYTLRYRLGSTGEVIAESEFEVVALNAGIVAPAEAAAGSTITVTWTGPGGAQDRIALARPDQSSFQWLEAHKTSDGAELTFTLPAEAGTYEFRYVDVTNRVVLATVAVQAK